MTHQHLLCPKCGKEMDAGWVYRPGGAWVKEKPDFLRSLISWAMNRQELIYPADGEHSRRAWRCRECDLLLTCTTSNEEPERVPWTPVRVTIAVVVICLTIFTLGFVAYRILSF